MYAIRESSVADLAVIAECQAACFPKSMGVLLGKKTIAKSLEWFLIEDKRFLVQLEEDGKIVGFLGGFAPRFIGDGSKSGMFRHSLPVAILQFIKKPWLLLHKEVRGYAPFFLKNTMLRLKRRLFGQSPVKKVSLDNLSDYTRCLQLTVVGVHPSHRRKGYGQALLQQLEKYAEFYQMPQLQLSVKKKNEAAIDVYAKAGWHISGELEDTYQMKKKL